VTWKIEFDHNAAKEFKKLDKSSQLLIRNYLRDKVLAASHPTKLGKSLVQGLAGLWRYRVDKFRIICKIEQGRLTILVLKVAKRDKVYAQTERIHHFTNA
jgi:mRNA interferase RelE/StbE